MDEATIIHADPRVKTYEYWHDAVFGTHPTRARIPFRILRDYLDYMAEYDRAKRGINDSLLVLSIPEIKRRARVSQIKMTINSQYGKDPK